MTLNKKNNVVQIEKGRRRSVGREQSRLLHRPLVEVERFGIAAVGTVRRMACREKLVANIGCGS